MRLFRHHHSHNSGFTLIELLVVIAIIAILAVVVVLVLNPAQMLAQSRDANRLSDASTLVNALTYFSEDTNGRMGTSSVIYTSIPDPAATTTAGNQCQSIGLPSLASSTYNCPASSTFRLGNGTGWIPLDFSRVSYGTPLNSIPVDPENSSTTGNYYTYTTNGKTFEVTMAFESLKYAPIEANDGGQYADLYEAGSNLGLMQSDLFALKNAYALFFDSPKTIVGSSTVTYTFSGTKNEIVNMGITGINNCNTHYYIYNPDGSTLASGSTCGSTLDFTNQTLPSDGTYKFTITPGAAYNNTVTLTNPLNGTISLNSPSTIVSSYSGQTAFYTFPGTSGQLLSVALSGINSCATHYYVYNPDGSTLASGSTCGSTMDFTNKTLPATGTYTLSAVPSDSAKLNTTVTFTTQLTGTIAFDSPTTITSSYSGQTASYTFQGTANEIADVSLTGINSCATSYSIYNPDGSTLVSGSTCGSTIVWSDRTLPSTGTYTLNAVPSDSAKLNTTVTLSNTVTGTIPLNSPTLITSSYSGQDASYTFSGNQGEILNIGLYGINSCATHYYVYNPDGSTLASGSTCGSTMDFTNKTLPATGTYTFDAIPSDSAKLNTTVTLSDQLTGTIPFESPTTISSPYAGQTAEYTFSGTAGEMFDIGITGIRSCSTNYYIYNPDGSTLASGSTCSSVLDFINETLPTTGTYRFDAVPADANTLNSTVSLSDEITGTMPFNTATTMKNDYVAQASAYTFDGTAGQIVKLSVTGINNCSTRYSIINPDGSTLISGTTCGSSLSLASSTLASTGTYSVTVIPSGGDMYNNTVTLSN